MSGLSAVAAQAGQAGTLGESGAHESCLESGALRRALTEPVGEGAGAAMQQTAAIDVS